MHTTQSIQVWSIVDDWASSSLAACSSASTTSTSKGNVRMAATPVSWFSSACGALAVRVVRYAKGDWIGCGDEMAARTLASLVHAREDEHFSTLLPDRVNQRDVALTFLHIARSATKHH